MKKDYFAGVHAEHYDDDSDMFASEAVDPAVDFLADLTRGLDGAPEGEGSGEALEFGIGTGRIALPLSRRGVRVHGIDLSPDMVAQLRAKPGAEEIGVTIGDFATATVGQTFRLVYLVFNTITNLTTQDDQVAVFENAATHLERGGSFVIEVFVPALRRLPPGERLHPFAASDDHLGFDEYDVATQGLVSHHYTRGAGGFEGVSVPFRYVWPAELDLMARLAGMRLRERFADWHRSPFTNDSTSHVSVWERG